MTTPTPATTVVAHPNIALVKYWGKRDEAWALPVTGNLSMTVDIFATPTCVTVTPQASADRLVLNGHHAAGRVRRLLDLVRERAGRSEHAVVRSRNQGPTGGGAGVVATLTVAAASVYGPQLDARARSRPARRGRPAGRCSAASCTGTSAPGPGRRGTKAPSPSRCRSAPSRGPWSSP
ncbi:hypothetical protein [Nonomuraea sp. JJY05]|uniref:hypothetical protein n=1 Tax=Nonomuraea sp. JJY05 TaxID=3350255 RepID=UPI00373E60C4